jgi:serine protease Do
MFRKSSILVLISTAAASFAIGQSATMPAPRADRAVERFAFAFPGEGGYLGVQTVDVNKENFSKYGLRDVRGVAVERVSENSPAAAAGLKENDVIIRIDGEDIASVRKLTRVISETAPDHRVKITFLRNGSEQEVMATLGKRQPMGFATPGAFTMPRIPEIPMSPDGPNVLTVPRGAAPQIFRFGGRQIGVGVEPLTKQLAAHFNVEHGLLVSEVRENSPAAKAGLKAGDIIVEADGKAVKNDFELVRAIGDKKEGDISITYVRGGSRQTVNVTPEAAKDGGFVFRTEKEDTN